MNQSITKRTTMLTIGLSSRSSACLPVVDIADTLLKGIPHFLALGKPYVISSMLYFIGLVTAAITQNERYHQFYALFFLVQTIVISFILFQILV